MPWEAERQQAIQGRRTGLVRARAAGPAG
jgi:hypothetical protein